MNEKGTRLRSPVRGRSYPTSRRQSFDTASPGGGIQRASTQTLNCWAIVSRPLRGLFQLFFVQADYLDKDRL